MRRLTISPAALRLDPDFVDGYEARAEAFLAKTDAKHAVADLDEAISLDPKRARDYYLRGSIRYDQYMGFLGGGWIEKDDLERAIADFGEAIRLDDQSAAAHYARGLAEGTNGQERSRGARFRRGRPAGAEQPEIRGGAERDQA